jgi:hypothetical protein
VKPELARLNQVNVLCRVSLSIDDLVFGECTFLEVVTKSNQPKTCKSVKDWLLLQYANKRSNSFLMNVLENPFVV